MVSGLINVVFSEGLGMAKLPKSIIIKKNKPGNFNSFFDLCKCPTIWHRAIIRCNSSEMLKHKSNKQPRFITSWHTT